MTQPIRQLVMAYLRKQKRPRTRAQITAALPNLPSNSVNRMLRDMVRRGTAVESADGIALAPLEKRVPVASTREDI